MVDGGGERVVAGVRPEVDLPADGDAVHVDLHEQAALVCAPGPAVAALDPAVLMMSGRRLG